MTQTTFREAYGVLQRHAETLRNQREPNIDDLLNIVTESVDAGVEPGAGPASSGVSASQSHSGIEDDGAPL